MSRDLREYARQTNLRLLIGGIVIIFIVGEGLIYIIYGINAAFTGLICFIAGIFPLFIIWIILSLMGWIADKAAN